MKVNKIAELIEIDGNYGEGGGQVIRTALALSVLTQKPFHVSNIRANRPDKGMKAQHLYCLKILECITDCKEEICNIGSTEFTFSPKKLQVKDLKVDIGTAGSITLLLQSILLPFVFGDKKTKLKIKGGTDVLWSMPYNYFEKLYLPYIELFADVKITMEKRGFYPKGQGAVEIEIVPKYNLNDYKDFNHMLKQIRKDILPIITILQGELKHVSGISFASKELEKASVAERQQNAARKTLHLECPIKIDVEYDETASIGTGIVLFAEFEDKEGRSQIIGADSMGEIRKRAETVGEEAAKKLLDEIERKSCVDSHMADNLIPFLAIIGGKIKTLKITEHTRTNIYVTELFLDCKFKIDEEEKIIECE